MSIIESVAIRRILDSRGQPTVEIDLSSGSHMARVAAPSGASTGKHEARPFPEGGVDEAIRVFRAEVALKLIGRDSRDHTGVDQLLKDLDGTGDFSRIGGNVATAASLATAKLAAASVGLPLYRYLAGGEAKTLPFPFGNVIGGGRHAVGGTTFQEFLVVSMGPSVAGNVFANARVHRLVKDRLSERFPDQPLGRGDEGAWVARLGDEQALSMLSDVCREVEKDVKFPVRPALDPAASEFYRDGWYQYRDRSLTPDKQVEFLIRLVDDYGVYALEDPLEEEDFDGFARLTEAVGSRCKIIGDDIFVTNTERLRRGIERGAANAILIKPNQVGTLTDTVAAVQMAHRSGYATVISHRSGETTDDTIAHLAVAFGCLGIKTGTVGGERIAKLNELIRIEESMARGTHPSREGTPSPRRE